MKKSILFIGILALLVSSTGCNQEDSSSLTSSSTVQQTTTESIQTTKQSVSESGQVQTTTTRQTEPTSVQQIDFRRIEGDWYVDGSLDAAHLSIDSNGNFSAYYATGSLEQTGLIQCETEKEGDTVTNWYYFYTDDGALYFKFADTQTGILRDFYTDGANPVHYVLVGGLADDGKGDETDSTENMPVCYLGVWGCGRATLRITENTDGSYLGWISWADSAFAHTEWEYPLVYDAASKKLVCTGNATKTEYVYQDASSDPTVTVCYTDGSGSFSYSNQTILWSDEQEDAGKDMEFIQ